MKIIFFALLLISSSSAFANVQTLRGSAPVLLQREVTVLNVPNLLYNFNVVFWGIVTAPTMVGMEHVVQPKANIELLTKVNPVQTNLNITIMNYSNQVHISAPSKNDCGGFDLILNSSHDQNGTIYLSIPGHLRADYFSGNSREFLPDLIVASLQAKDENKYQMGIFIE